MDPYFYLHVGRSADLSNPRDRRLYRALEIMPGVLAWGTLGIVVAISFWFPVFAALFIICFDVYWLVKTIYLSLLMRSTFSRMRTNLKRSWREELDQLPPAHGEGIAGLRWPDVYHLVVLPMAHEPIEIVRASFAALTRINYPLDRLLVVLATEGRSGDHGKTVAEHIQKEFGHQFGGFLVTVHPSDIPGEIIGKGSNEAWAGKQALVELIRPRNLDPSHVVVSVFDIDTVVHTDFFGCLTWYYLTSDHPLRSSFQPIPLFINNIWEAPAFARVFAFSTTFWQMIQQARHEQLITFSSQSIGLAPLIDVGFWQGNMVSEDSRIFWQCLLRFDGDWRTIPMYFPVAMDANVAPTFWQTLINQYKQIRRWHFGVENNPYFLFGFWHNNRIPWKTKLYFTFTTVERSHSSPTNALIIFILGWLPLLIGGAAFTHTVLAFNLPRLTATIMNISMLGLITSAALSMALLPPRPAHFGRHNWILMFLQWLLFPVNFIFFGAVPALDAQTRLMLGNHLGFWVTPKIRKSSRVTRSDTTVQTVLPVHEAGDTRQA